MKFLLFGLLLKILVHCGSCQWNEDANMLYNNNDYNNHNNPNNNSSATLEPGMWRQARRSSQTNGCTTDEGTPGTCMTRFNCMRQGGVVKGFCSAYGICCETNLQCSGVTRLKRTIIKNPAQVVTTQCQYTVEPYSNNVCQLLIEFQRFELRQPEVAATNDRIECIDYFRVGGYTLCGDNTQQHLYLPFNAAAGASSIQLLFYLPSMSTQNTWHLVVTQLECPVEKRRIGNGLMSWGTGPKNLQDLRTIFSTHNSDLDLLAPPGCDQYFTQPSGQIKSFNYRDGANSYYMPNLKYTICIKHIPGSSMIEYTVNKFSLPAEIAGQYYDEYCHPIVYTAERDNDYLMIPQSFFLDQPHLQPVYFCGLGLVPNQMLIAAAPYIMYFSSDDLWSPVETGFSITYRVKTII